LSSTTQNYTFDLFKITLLEHQPTAKISDQLLDTLIDRDYKSNAAIVKTKLNNIYSDSQAGKNRIAAGILKLADKNFDALDELIERANNDCRDIFMWAEYPRCAKLGFDELDKKQMQQIYIDDFNEYSNWLNK
jgi:hypothetical protein